VPDHESHGWQDSPLIREALRDGRQPDDICFVFCDRCDSVTYYDQGSHCTCEWCEANLDHLLNADAGEVITLADLWDAPADDEADDEADEDEDLP
jgi:hypothetical protein